MARTSLNNESRLILRPVVRFIPLEDERWGVWLGLRRKQLGGKSLNAVLPRVLDLLDGRHTVGEICARASEGGDLSPELVREVLVRLYDWLIVDDVVGYPDAADHTLAPLEAQLKFFALGSSVPVEMQRRVTDSSVAVLGMDGLGEHVALGLARAGVGKLILRGGDPVLPVHRGLFDYGEADQGRPAAEVMAERIAAIRADIEISLDDAPDDRVPEADFAVVVGRGLHNDRLAALNRACVEAGLSFLAVGREMIHGYVGPIVRPRESACLECVTVRFQRTSSGLEAEMGSRDELIEPSPLSAMVASLGVMEVIKYLTHGMPLALVGAQLQVDAAGLTVSRSPVLRLPRCAVCGALAAHAPRISFDVAAIAGSPDEA